MTRKIIASFGGTQALMRLTGFTKGYISHFRTQGFIPKPWLMLMFITRPDIDWSEFQAELDEAFAGVPELYEKAKKSARKARRETEHG